MKQFIKTSFNNYFNIALRTALNYPEVFTINVNLNEREITLNSNINSQLIQLLKIDDKLFDDLSNQILFTLQQFNSEIGLIIIKLIDEDEIKINYQVSFEALSQIDINANIAAYLSLEEIENLCKYNESFQQTCNRQSFWIQLFNNKYGKIPDYIPKDINYKKLYIDVLTYYELVKAHKGAMEMTINYTKLLDLINDMSKYSIIYILKSSKRGLLYRTLLNSLDQTKYLTDIDIIKILVDKSIHANLQMGYIFKLAFTDAYNDNIYDIIEFLITIPNREKRLHSHDVKKLISKYIRDISREQGRDKLYFNDRLLNLLEDYIKTKEPDLNIRDYISRLFRN